MRNNSLLISILKKTYYPPFEIQLLQKAEIAPLIEARKAWAQWRNLDRLDDISWQEQKILARMFRRISELDSTYKHLPRIIGFMKSEWARSQVNLKASLVGVDLLLEHDFKLMLFKGLAWEESQGAKGIRLSGDLDILVPNKDFINALKLLEENNWSTEDDTSWQKYGIIPKYIHALNYTHNNGGNIDLHCRPLHTYPGEGYLDELWKRSRQGIFRGRPMYFCSNADYSALLIAHSLGGIKEMMSSIWPGDFHRIIKKLDAHSIADFRSIILKINKSLECELALRYCEDILCSYNVRRFSRQIDPFKISIQNLLHAIFTSSMAYQRGTLFWLFAGSFRFLSRQTYKVINVFLYAWSSKKN